MCKGLCHTAIAKTLRPGRSYHCSSVCMAHGVYKGNATYSQSPRTLRPWPLAPEGVWWGDRTGRPPSRLMQLQRPRRPGRQAANEPWRWLIQTRGFDLWAPPIFIKFIGKERMERSVSWKLRRRSGQQFAYNLQTVWHSAQNAVISRPFVTGSGGEDGSGRAICARTGQLGGGLGGRSPAAAAEAAARAQAGGRWLRCLRRLAFVGDSAGEEAPRGD